MVAQTDATVNPRCDVSCLLQRNNSLFRGHFPLWGRNRVISTGVIPLTRGQLCWLHDLLQHFSPLKKKLPLRPNKNNRLVSRPRPHPFFCRRIIFFFFGKYDLPQKALIFLIARIISGASGDIHREKWWRYLILCVYSEWLMNSCTRDLWYCSIGTHVHLRPLYFGFIHDQTQYATTSKMVLVCACILASNGNSSRVIN